MPNVIITIWKLTKEEIELEKNYHQIGGKTTPPEVKEIRIKVQGFNILSQDIQKQIIEELKKEL